MNRKLDIDRQLYDRMSAQISNADNKEAIGVVLMQAQGFVLRGSILEETYERLMLIAKTAQESLLIRESVRKDALKTRKISELFRDTDDPIRIFSKKLGEEILLVKDGWVPPPDEKRVWYQQSEMKVLVGWSDEALRAIHAAKKVFHGCVEEPDNTGGSSPGVIEEAKVS